MAGIIRSVIAGAVWTPDRRHRARMVTTPTCAHCDQEVVKDLLHIWWGCPKWETIRLCHGKAVAARQLDWSACLEQCGITPVGLYSVATERGAIARDVQLMMMATILV